MSVAYRWSKRLLDIMLSLFVLLISSPVWLLVSLAIKLDSPGPIVFKQQRAGLKGKVFWIYKFRTMVRNAEQLGPKVTAERDPRVTRVGHLLRKTKLDELPQFWNVLKGDMSIVGPRPEVAQYLRHYGDRLEIFLSVPPGITGPGQIQYYLNESVHPPTDLERYYFEVGLPAKLTLDCAYATRQSLLYDLWVICQTVVVILLYPFLRARTRSLG